MSNVMYRIVNLGVGRVRPSYLVGIDGCGNARWTTEASEAALFSPANADAAQVAISAAGWASILEVAS